MSDFSFVSATDRPIDLAEEQRKAAVLKKARPRSVGARTGNEYDDFMSLGFVVEGLTHAMLADARDARRQAIDSYDADCALAKEQRRAAPQKPLPFDEEQWLHTAKRVKVRARPYEIRSSAEQCRELALKAGWLIVSVRELRRERK